MIWLPGLIFLVHRCFFLGSGYVNYGDTERKSSRKTAIKKERTDDRATKQILDDLLRDDVS